MIGAKPASSVMPDMGTPAAKHVGHAFSASHTPVPPSEMPVR